MTIKGFNNRSFEGTQFFDQQNTVDTLEKPYGKKQTFFLKAVIIFCTALLFVSLINLQIIHGEGNKQLAEQNRIRVYEVKPLRGIIYDDKNVPLVYNKPSFTLLAVPADLYQNNFQPEKLIDEFGIVYESDQARQDAVSRLSVFSYVPIVLKKNLSYQNGVKLIPKIEKTAGVYLEETFQRTYPFGSLFSHILGYTRFVNNDDMSSDPFYSLTDSRGATGIEYEYEARLRGVKGKQKVQVNSLGKEDKTFIFIPAQKGDDITLTIDYEIQKKLFEILENAMKKESVERAASIVMNPSNGAILALVSFPGYDNNVFTSNTADQSVFEKLFDNQNRPLFNRAISGAYPPGSTFKLIVGAAALEEGISDERFTVFSKGGIQVGQWFFPDWLAGGHGITDIKKGIAWSVNTYFYTIGGGFESKEGLGVERIARYASLFNVGKKTGIDIPEEAAGLVPTEEWKKNTKNEPWYLGDTYHLSIGQGDILATPLQIALWTSFFANNGILYKPHLINDGPKIIDKNFISSQNIKIIKEGLRDAVRYGSAHSIESLGIQAAGKTGSAEFANNKKPHGWFTGFAPYDKPEIVITVLMEESQGSQSAVPVAREFFDWYFNNNKNKEQELRVHS